jgi:putative transposase
MLPLSIQLKALRHCAGTISRVLFDLVELFRLTTKSRSALVAENLFLRKQLALFQERKTKPRRADDSTRWLMSFVSRWFDWRNALVVVKPDTLIRWHRKGFRLFWRWESRPKGRPRLPKDLQALIRQMARENPSWGEGHIANELKLKLGIRVSPRTVGKYLAQGPCRKPDPSQRWLTFVRNHAQAMVACDFFVVVTARFCILDMCSFSWNWAGARSCTSTSPSTPARSGPSSNCGKPFLEIIRSASSSTTGTAFSPRNWIEP